MAGFAAAQVHGHSREPAFRAGSVELSFGVAVQYVERYITPRIPRVCGEQIIQPAQGAFPVAPLNDPGNAGPPPGPSGPRDDTGPDT